MSRLAIVSVPAELLLSRLGLPEGARLDDVRMRFDANGMIDLRIEHADLDPVPHGFLIPKHTAVVTREELPCGCERDRFERWA